ncbi:hypothetical protein GCM10025771_08710 [Niveibacterium umoris]|uniref:Glutaredoxin n=1 Tax=Niveibacterium umoris TaxID=1193620 RepID=A0A840BKR9_9RHOO|nr:glutaredoxin family protein [Niveibacterium umoris]MBB4013580.1 glutaredoxin [Niveibacterium umoris]
MAETSRKPSSRTAFRAASASARKDKGFSLLGFLLLLCLGYGIYAFAFKPGNKAAKEETEASAPAAPQIVIYTGSSCEPCDRAKVWLTQRHLAFDERNVDTSSAYEDQLKQYKSRIVPVIVINGEPQYGFLPAYLEDALKNPGKPRRD